MSTNEALSLKSLFQILRVLFTLFIAFLGAQLFIILNLPLPWLLGAITATAVFSRFETIPLKSAKVLSSPARAILGLTVGSAFTPQLINYIDSFLISLMMIIPYVIVSAACGIYYYYKIIKLDKITAFLSAMPGGLLEMISIGEELGANVYKITLLQSTRLLFIVFSLPFIIELLGGTSLDGNRTMTQTIAEIGLLDICIMVFIAFTGVIIAKKIKLPGAWILGPMVLSIIFYMSGFIHVRPPDEVIKLVQIVLGSSVGFVFRGVAIKEVVKTIMSTMGYFIIMMIIGALFILLVSLITDFELLSILLAFTPGGQAEINLIAILATVNLPYVAIHHVFRMFLVMSTAPVVAKKLIK
jgi:membrane AbrB-like protein